MKCSSNKLKSMHTNTQFPYRVTQPELTIAAQEEDLGITIDSYTL